MNTNITNEQLKLRDYCMTAEYAARVHALEEDGLTTSDAQGVADAEFITRYRNNCFLEWSDLWAAMKVAQRTGTVGAWIPTTEKMFSEMLECVPPRAVGHQSFMVGEADHEKPEGTIYAAFKRVGALYFAKYMTLDAFIQEMKEVLYD